MSGGLRIENLTAGYAGPPVLDGLALPEIPRGSTVALLGPNAAGKSTLLRSIAGLIPATGSALLSGKNLRALPADERQRHAGYLPQTLPLPSSLLAYELVLSTYHGGDPATRDARIQAVFQQLGLEDLAFRRVRELSSGKRQLVGLAQVLVREPELLLLDEPTSALDLHWQISVLQNVRESVLRRNAIALIAVHDLNLALRFCDTAVLLSHGKVLACGPSAEVITPPLLRQAYHIEARIECCSQGFPIVICDQPLPFPSHPPTHPDNRH